MAEATAAPETRNVAVRQDFLESAFNSMATEKARQSGFLEELAKASPRGRGGEPREMADCIVSGGCIYA
jgi:hypothetical protein